MQSKVGSQDSGILSVHPQPAFSHSWPVVNYITFVLISIMWALSRKGRMKTRPGPRIVAFNSTSNNVNVRINLIYPLESWAQHNSSLVLLAPLEDKEERERGGDDHQEQWQEVKNPCHQPSGTGFRRPLSKKCRRDECKYIIPGLTCETSNPLMSVMLDKLISTGSCLVQNRL